MVAEKSFDALVELRVQMVNILLDDPLYSFSQQFTDLLSSTNLTQHVSVSIHIPYHTLDLAIISSNTNLSPTISQSFITVSDDYPIFTHLNLTPTPPPPLTTIIFFGAKNININEFNNDLASSDLILHPPTSLPELLDSYDSTLYSTLDNHTPLITKLSNLTNSTWYNAA